MVEILNIIFFCPNFLDFRSVMFLFFLGGGGSLFGCLTWSHPFFGLEKSLVGFQVLRDGDLQVQPGSSELLGKNSKRSPLVENGHINPRNFI